MRTFSEFLRQRNEAISLADLRAAAANATPIQDDPDYWHYNGQNNRPSSSRQKRKATKETEKPKNLEGLVDLNALRDEFKK